MLGYAIYLPTYKVSRVGQRGGELERENENHHPYPHFNMLLIHGQGLPPAEIFNYHISAAPADNEDNCFIHFVKLK